MNSRIAFDELKSNTYHFAAEISSHLTTLYVSVFVETVDKVKYTFPRNVQFT